MSSAPITEEVTEYNAAAIERLATYFETNAGIADRTHGSYPVSGMQCAYAAKVLRSLMQSQTASEKRVSHLEDGMLEIINGIGCDRDQNIARTYLAKGDPK